MQYTTELAVIQYNNTNFRYSRLFDNRTAGSIIPTATTDNEPAQITSGAAMSLPKVFVMRNDWEMTGNVQPRYMSEANLKLLGEFAQIEHMGGGCGKPLSPKELAAQMADTRVILNLNGSGADEITEESLRNIASLKAVVTVHSACWGSLERTAKSCGVPTAEGSNAIDMSVAEWTVACAIMGRRRMIEGGASLKDRGIWQHEWEKEGIIFTSTVGLLGLGRIGRLVARYMGVLGAKVIAYDKYMDTKLAETLGVELVGLDELLGRANVISLHLPVTAETEGILKAREFSMIRDSAVFINSARAALYDEDALVAELRRGRFSAYIDVYSLEGNVKPPYVTPADRFRNPYQRLDNVFLTSHSAGTNQAMYERAGAESIENVRLFLEGKGLRDMRNIR